MSALALVRTVHYVALAQAFGALVFATLIAPAHIAGAVVDRFVTGLARWSVGIALLSWLGWLLLQAPAMAGIELRALDVSTLGLVVRGTSFGRVWLGRLVLIIIVAGVLALRGSAWRDRVAAIAALALVATLAATGHAAADSGRDKAIHMGADALHLVAAGAWLGALLPLAVALRRTLAPRTYAITRRFSSVGVAAVLGLLVTGIVNAIYLVASWPPLFGTAYGQWLIAKIALFAMMLSLALTNRLRWTADMESAGPPGEFASAHIARNAGVEAALGLGVLTIVGVLGLSVPAAHDETRWPFPFRLSFDEGALPEIVRAYPTTYLHPPIGYTVTAVARGSALFAANCAVCHGVEGRGDGPAAATLAMKPADLASEHVLGHLDGDLYGWITHGIDGTPMPAFVAALDDTARWDLVYFVKTLAAGAVGVDVEAPQFAYQIDQQPQRTTGERPILLVLYSLPESRDRLLQLSAVRDALSRAGVDVVAVPSSREAPRLDDTGPAINAATVSPGLSEAYRVLAGNVPASDRHHVEFLVDRNGTVRARWDARNLAAVAEIAQRAGALETEAPRPPRRMVHMRHN